MLTALSDLGDVGSRVIEASTDDTVANLRALQPVLTKLNEAGDSLPASLELLLTYPFPDQALAAMKGDYTNLHLTMDLDLRSLLGLAGSDGGGLGSLALPGLTTMPDLKTVPGLENLPGVGGLGSPQPGESAQPATGSAGLPALPGVPTSGTPSLPALDAGDLCVPGLPCLTEPQGTAGTDGADPLGRAIDPGLMSLLLGGLATGTAPGAQP
jgi:phospholipid/cholesterol/gamma-HCH transport system substrate-binding protein